MKYWKAICWDENVVKWGVISYQRVRLIRMLLGIYDAVRKRRFVEMRMTCRLNRAFEGELETIEICPITAKGLNVHIYGLTFPTYVEKMSLITRVFDVFFNTKIISMKAHDSYGVFNFYANSDKPLRRF